MRIILRVPVKHRPRRSAFYIPRRWDPFTVATHIALLITNCGLVPLSVDRIEKVGEVRVRTEVVVGSILQRPREREAARHECQFRASRCGSRAFALAQLRSESIVLVREDAPPGWRLRRTRGLGTTLRREALRARHRDNGATAELASDNQTAVGPKGRPREENRVPLIYSRGRESRLEAFFGTSVRPVWGVQSSNARKHNSRRKI